MQIHETILDEPKNKNIEIIKSQFSLFNVVSYTYYDSVDTLIIPMARRWTSVINEAQDSILYHHSHLWHAIKAEEQSHIQLFSTLWIRHEICHFIAVISIQEIDESEQMRGIWMNNIIQLMTNSSYQMIIHNFVQNYQKIWNFDSILMSMGVTGLKYSQDDWF